MNRRNFVKKSSIAYAASFGFPSILISQDGVTPNNRLNVACIGCGGKGASDTRAASEGNNIVALCDVDDKRAGKTLKEYPKATQFTDYREMFDKLGKEIDAVTISTPDHMHFPIAMHAMSLGKHVCVQKPLANTIWEARQLLAASRKYGVKTQMGIQGHTMEGIRLLKEWLDADAIGEVREIIYWTNRPIWPQGPDLKFPEEPVPAGMNWDVWQGTVPERPYNSGICPRNWRGWWDYGCGALGDIGCHAMDAGFWALNLGAPEWAEASSTPFTKDICPASSQIEYQFPARGNRPAVKVTWMDGEMKPPKPEGFDDSRELGEQWGQLFIGDKGTIFVSDAYCSTLRLLPEEKMKSFMRDVSPPKVLKRSPTPGQPQKEWVHCIKNGGDPGANFEYAVPLTEMVLVGNLALRSQRRVMWDSPNMRVTNSESVNQYIKRTYRKGWEPVEIS
ncbi:MAG: putative dehydrogenase [Verrucomicrobiales bacterium]|jgi:predicted dehydrogenase